MARTLSTNRQIDAYIRMVIQKARHHAPNVEHVVFPLSQAVRARVTLGVDDVSVYERNGVIGRSCWVTVGGRRWAFSYDYSSATIDLRQGGIQGPVVFQFHNATSGTAILTQASRL